MKTLTRPIHALTCLMLGIGLIGLTACHTGPPVGAPNYGFDMQPSHSSILVGETVTFTTSTQNTMGKDARIEWHTTGGEMELSDANRIAQITFEEAGLYTISADLIVGGDRYETQSTTIRVKPLRVPVQGSNGMDDMGDM